MAMSWTSALGAMDDSLEGLLARRSQEQAASMQILRQLEAQRQAREDEATAREETEMRRQYYDSQEERQKRIEAAQTAAAERQRLQQEAEAQAAQQEREKAATLGRLRKDYALETDPQKRRVLAASIAELDPRYEVPEDKRIMTHSQAIRAGRVPPGTVLVADRPAPKPPEVTPEQQNPAGVRAYLQTLRGKKDEQGREYSLDRAMQEVVNHWSELRQTHPNLDPTAVRAELRDIFSDRHPETGRIVPYAPETTITVRDPETGETFPIDQANLEAFLSEAQRLGVEDPRSLIVTGGD